MELWPQWIGTLQAHQPELKLHLELLQVAEDERVEAMRRALAHFAFGALATIFSAWLGVLEARRRLAAQVRRLRERYLLRTTCYLLLATEGPAPLEK